MRSTNITVDIKYKSPVTLRLGTRIIILSNEEPRLPDASGAIISRFIALKLTNSFYGREDIELEQKLLAELPGVLKILVKGLQRLMRRGRFVQPESGREVLSATAIATCSKFWLNRKWIMLTCSSGCVGIAA